MTLQYKSHYEGELDAQIQSEMYRVKEKTDVANLTLHGLYNALNCIGYQIETEHLEELRSLTTSEKNALTFLQEIKVAIGEQIIRELPEDHTNKWEVR